MNTISAIIGIAGLLSTLGVVIYVFAAVLYFLTLGTDRGLSWIERLQIIPKRLHRFGITCVCVLLGAVAIGRVAEFVYWRNTPPGLFIHIDSMPWESVTVKSNNLSEPRQFTSESREPLALPIAYGEYRIGIRLPDGQVVWSDYIHTDAGVRRRVDVFVSPSARAGYIHFRQTENRGRELFTGETRPEDTSEEQPFPLAGV